MHLFLVYVCMHVCMFACPLGAGVIGGCESPAVGTGSWTWVFCNSNKHPLPPSCLLDTHSLIAQIIFPSMDWWAMRTILSIWQSPHYGFGVSWHRLYVYHDYGHRSTPWPCPVSGSPHWTGWIQLLLSEWVLHSSVQRSFVYFFLFGYCPLRVKNYKLSSLGLRKVLLFGVYCVLFIRSNLEILCRAPLSGFTPFWRVLEETGPRNKHFVNIKLSLSWQIPS